MPWHQTISDRQVLTFFPPPYTNRDGKFDKSWDWTQASSSTSDPSNQLTMKNWTNWRTETFFLTESIWENEQDKKYRKLLSKHFSLLLSFCYFLTSAWIRVVLGENRKGSNRKREEYGKKFKFNDLRKNWLQLRETEGMDYPQNWGCN